MRRHSVNASLTRAFVCAFAVVWSLPGAAKERASATLSVKAFCEAFENAELTQRLGPCTGAKAADPVVAKLTETALRARHQCIELINSGVSQKRQRFDADGARRCLAAEVALAADPRRSQARHEAVRTACEHVAVGLLGVGKECESALDCRDSLACIGPKGAPPGTCTARLAKGHACDDEELGQSRFYPLATIRRAPCADGLHCSSAGAELLCASDLGLGRECAGTDPAACGPGLRCGLGRCTAETLTAPGEVCNGLADCAVGLYCDGGACAQAKAAGAACARDEECKGTCRRGQCAALCSSG